MRENGRLRADVLASQALAYLALAGYVAAVYAAVVVGIGAVLGRGQPDLALSVAATAIVAVTFEPARDAAWRLASRVIYRRRTTPYQALSRLAKRAGAAYATDEVLPMMAKVLADGLGAAPLPGLAARRRDVPAGRDLARRPRRFPAAVAGRRGAAGSGRG